MNELVVALGWAGLFAPMALGAIGCAVAGQAAIGAMVDTESGYGRYIGVSVMPSSQVIYAHRVRGPARGGADPARG
jgi:V/A-type H+-transporting ATPase subunit K